MFSFNELDNPDNIDDTSKLEYQLQFSSQMAFCQICGIIIQYYVGKKSYYHTPNEYYICDECYTQLRCPTLCRMCGKGFYSKNKLFIHLYEFPKHQIGPLKVEMDDDTTIEFLTKDDLTLFKSPPGFDVNKHSLNYEKMFSTIRFCYPIGTCTTQLDIFTRYKQFSIPEILEINYNTTDLECFNKIYINWGEITLYVDRIKSIGWIQFQEQCYIPIQSIIYTI